MEEKMRNAFVSAFSMEASQFSLDLTPDQIAAWDSLGHLRLVTALQEQFEIEFDVDEVMQMEDARKILEILTKRGLQ